MRPRLKFLQGAHDGCSFCGGHFPTSIVRMPTPLGSLCIVLHGHLPYVLHHGEYPHGEAWLFEGVAETYLPLFEVLDDLAGQNITPGLTIGLTPVLLEQLASDYFKSGFVAYLNGRIDRARQDRREFETHKQRHFARLAAQWEELFIKRLEQFEKLGRDVIAPIVKHANSGNIELLGGPATHAYLPLLLNEQSIRAQLALGRFTTKKHLRRDCPGAWLPECAYQPAWEKWIPWVLFGDPRGRPGTEHFLSHAGFSHFFIDTPLLDQAEPMGRMNGHTFEPFTGAPEQASAPHSGRSPLAPVGVVSQPEAPRCFALARHPQVSAQVWSGKIGYPGAGEYLEFHRKQGEHGLRYHRVTDIGMALSEKQAYLPEPASQRVREHAAHFCQTVRQALADHLKQAGEPGVCVAPFDAELFGHWWFEGPAFLRELLIELSRDERVSLVSAEQALERRPPRDVVRLPEGSWGKGGKHEPWLNDQTRWMWEVEYRAENQLLKLLHDLPWRERPDIRAVLERLARELVLLQASDWPFVVHSQGAVDYGMERFSLHATRFNRLSAIAQTIASGKTPTAVQLVELSEIDAHDIPFKDIDLEWWL